MSPTLSALLTNYNDGRYLRESLDALLAQTRRPEEIIVVEDGSTDDSADILRDYAQRDSTIKPVFHDQNRGPLRSLTHGLELTSGDYVVGLAADNPVFPPFCEKGIGLLARYPQAGFCCADYRTLYPDGSTTTRPIRVTEQPAFVTPAQLRATLRDRIRFSFPTSTCIWRREALLSMGGYPPELKWHTDWFVALVLAFRHGFCYLPETLATLRYSPSSYSNAGVRNWQAQGEVLSALLAKLDTPAFADVRSDFALPAVLARFGVQILLLAASHPRWWSYLSPELVLRAIRNEQRLPFYASEALSPIASS